MTKHGTLGRAAAALTVAAIASTIGMGTAQAADSTVVCRPIKGQVAAPPDVSVAQRIYDEGRSRNVSGTVMLAAFEVAKVESNFRNCRDGDGTSLGAFQQIDPGWGSAEERTTVRVAAGKFFVRAVDAERNHPERSASTIAQMVQRSGYPTRYEDNRADAEAMLKRVRPAIERVQNGAGTRIVGPNAYMDVSGSGQVYAWNARYLGGSPGGYSGRFVDAKVTRNDEGYWLLTSRGQIYAYGNAPYKGGSPSGVTGDIVAMAANPDGQGYVLVSATGQVYAYGSSGYLGGSPSGYSGEFVDVETAPSGRGYWLLTSAGQVYSYGDAVYAGGSPTGFDRAIVAMSPAPDGRGYVLVSKTGQVYAYGTAAYRGGSPGGISGEIADISHTTGSGYVLISTQGQHYAYGDAPFVGNPSGQSASF